MMNHTDRQNLEIGYRVGIDPAYGRQHNLCLFGEIVKTTKTQVQVKITEGIMEGKILRFLKNSGREVGNSDSYHSRSLCDRDYAMDHNWKVVSDKRKRDKLNTIEEHMEKITRRNADVDEEVLDKILEAFGEKL